MTWGDRACNGRSGHCALGFAALLVGFSTICAAPVSALPEIRLSQVNAVPACVTPRRLMQFLKSRNGQLDPRYKDIALLYRQEGELQRVRWDYAFFQMAVETNFLTYRRPSGSMGDVDPGQNNFAGIGTTGGGVPGDSFPDIATGVRAQMQHLVVYSGESVAEPVANRTRLKQDIILLRSRALNRPVRFSDLAGRWAADRDYGRSIESVAGGFRAEHCSKTAAADAARAIKIGTTVPSSPPERRVAQVRDTPTVRTIWSRDAAAARPSGPQPAAQAPAKSVPVPAPALPQPSQTPAAATEGTASATPFGAQPSSARAVAGEEESPLTLVAPPRFPLGKTAQEPPAPTELPAKAKLKSSITESTFNPKTNPPSKLGGNKSCSVDTASYGGAKTVLIRSGPEGAIRYTALSVLEGFEKSMTHSFINAKAPDGELVGEFTSKDAALAAARDLCARS